MRQPPKSARTSAPTDPLALLTGLGFGPDTLLMNDPKLFVDGRFLASLLVELEDELDDAQRPAVLFQIGLLHGLRDAARVLRAHDEIPAPAGAVRADTPSLVMRWTPGPTGPDADGVAIEGSWPEQHEAAARCARLGASEGASCWMSAGYTTGWLSGTLDRTILAHEVECVARGDAACRFEARELDEAHARGEADIRRFLAEIPFDAFRRIAASPPIERSAGPADAEVALEGHFDRSQAVVHIWGPVMVLPFTTLDEALGTVELLGRDPGIGEIRAVIVDLREQPLDEGFGAAALEQILETIESWNAQSLITGVSPASEAAIASLESSHIVLRKDLSEAIATAFQVCDAQRHVV